MWGFFIVFLAHFLSFVIFFVCLFVFFPVCQLKKKKAKNYAAKVSPHTAVCRFVRQTFFFFNLSLTQLLHLYASVCFIEGGNSSFELHPDSSRLATRVSFDTVTASRSIAEGILQLRHVLIVPLYVPITPTCSSLGIIRDLQSWFEEFGCVHYYAKESLQKYYLSCYLLVRSFPDSAI